MITLHSAPDRSRPCCFLVKNEDGRDLLIQTDWDWPAVARAFGWSIKGVQKSGLYATPCDHDGTDGTVDCETCGVTAHQFIQAAGEWLREHDGAKAEDPGYFDND